MALVKGTNSYNHISEADMYFEDRADVDSWRSSSDDEKAEALITATGILENQPWVGLIADSSQDLAWPRIGTYYDPRHGGHVILDSTATEVPTRVSNATYELAYNILNNDGILDSSSSAGSISVGSISLGFIQAADLFTYSVRLWLNPLLRNSGTSWFRAN